MAPAAKPASALLKKPKKTDKTYTKTQLVAHLAEAVTARGLGEVNKKQATAFLEELADITLKFAPLGATIPGIGKLVLRKTPRRPARVGRNPATGEEIQIPAKPAGQKLVFRIAKTAKDLCGK